MDDRFLMKRVLTLAKKGAGKVSPNPQVGALVVKNNAILSEGYHAYFGGPHAEVAALSKLGLDESRDSTLYVNLEPCTHFGKTPPCTDRIIQSKVRRVVVGAVDPNVLVRGKGIRTLQDSGIEVKVGILADACTRLNESYFKFITKKKPFITLKIAQTLDGKIATLQGNSQWITSESSRRQVQRMRKESDAVVVGVHTVIRDDPQLTIRLVPEGRLRRIILDSRLRIPLESRVLHHADPQNTIVVTTQKAPREKRQLLKNRGITVWTVGEDAKGRVDLIEFFKESAKRDIASLLVEGGREVFTSMLQTGEVDRVVIFIAPKLFGRGLDSLGTLDIQTPAEAVVFKESRWFHRDTDMVFEGRL